MSINLILAGSKKVHIFDSPIDNLHLVDFWILLKSKMLGDKSPSFLEPCQQAQNVFRKSWKHPSKHETSGPILGGVIETLPYDRAQRSMSQTA